MSTGTGTTSICPLIKCLLEMCVSNPITLRKAKIVSEIGLSESQHRLIITEI